MNNIWRFSLFLAFSSIIDQLIKGSIQSILDYEGMVKPILGNWLFVARDRDSWFDFSFYPGLVTDNFNTLSILVLTLVWIFCLYKIIKFRNLMLSLAWSYTFLLSGVFTSWLDRVSQGFVLKYIRIQLFNFQFSTGLGELLFWCGFLLLIPLEIRRVRI